MDKMKIFDWEIIRISLDHVPHHNCLQCDLIVSGLKVAKKNWVSCKIIILFYQIPYK